MRILFISWLFLTLFFQILFGSNTVLISGQCLDDQQSLLLQLKKSLNFSSSSSTKLVLWNQSSDCCLWDGVTCNTAGRVIGLDLNNESISGGFDDSSSLFSLQFLQSLNLAFNRFSFTQIPNGFGNLTSLTYLNLSNAGFAGQIPTEFSSMTRLVTLDLSTLFPGIHPLKLENPNLTMFVQNLSELKELRLDGVNISARGSDWCNAISSRLPYLLVLSLLNCDLSGPIDPSLLELRSLSVIRLAQNDFSSPVPEFFANFRNLTQLDLSSCNLNGTFPRRIIQVTTLQTLDLANNELLEGSLPEFSPYASLQNLVLSMTKFSGTLPDSIGNLEMLSRIELVRCNFSGRIPNSMAGLTQLVYLDFSSNNFTGSIPSFSLSKNLTNIDLSRNDLTGEIPSSHWEGLQSLVNLNLGYNSLNGSIPVSLFSLPSLQKIQLSNNKFAGQFNDILNVSSHKLDTLDLSSNNLTGPIPKFVFQLQGLKILSLSSNDFDGSIKLSMIENFKNLTTLDLSYNNLSVDATMSNFSGSSFPQISTLKLASCNLNVFPNLKNQSKLSYLDLSKNQIHGKIPNWVWNIGNGLPGYLNLSYNMLVEFEGPFPLVAANLSILDLHSNFLQGQIPIQAPSAILLDYSNNNFSSVIPAEISNNMSFTLFFSLSNNSLTGHIPDSICNITSLKVLDLSNNELTGTIPPCLIEMSKTLGVLNLQSNNLSGIVPDKFPKECLLKTLDFSKNKVEGTMPKSLASCTMLEVLNIGNNMINDIFPCWLKNSSSLRVLVLRSNKFHGGIRCSAGNIPGGPNLQIIDLAYNNFSGDLPPRCFSSWKAMMVDKDNPQSEINHLHFQLFQFKHFYYQDTVTVTIKGLVMELVKILTVFTSIDFSNNNFQGEIPYTVGDLTSLYILNLSSNALTGAIPSSIGNLTRLESLDLSRNKLNGSIPEQLGRLTFLSFLNVSYNLLVGTIPSGTQIQTFTATSFEGNKGLCGTPLNTSCNGTTLEPPSAPSSNQASSTPVTGFDWQFISTGLGFGVGAGIVVGPLMIWKQGRNCFDEYIDKFVLMILQTLGFIYISCDDVKVEVEETIEEPRDDSEDADDDEDEDEMEDKTFHGRYCVFCSKLDISRKKAIHNPKCDCHDSPPTSFSKLDISRKKAIHNPKCDCHDSPPTSFSSSSSSSSL